MIIISGTQVKLPFDDCVVTGVEILCASWLSESAVTVS